jgi:hypothetical protein
LSPKYAREIRASLRCNLAHYCGAPNLSQAKRKLQWGKAGWARERFLQFRFHDNETKKGNSSDVVLIEPAGMQSA